MTRGLFELAVGCAPRSCMDHTATASSAYTCFWSDLVELHPCCTLLGQLGRQLLLLQDLTQFLQSVCSGSLFCKIKWRLCSWCAGCKGIQCELSGIIENKLKLRIPNGWRLISWLFTWCGHRFEHRTFMLQFCFAGLESRKYHAAFLLVNFCLFTKPPLTVFKIKVSYISLISKSCRLTPD